MVSCRTSATATLKHFGANPSGGQYLNVSFADAWKLPAQGEPEVRYVASSPQGYPPAHEGACRCTPDNERLPGRVATGSTTNG